MGTSKLLGKPDEISAGRFPAIVPFRRSSNTPIVASCYGNRGKLRQSWATRLVRLYPRDLAGYRLDKTVFDGTSQVEITLKIKANLASQSTYHQFPMFP